MPQIENLNRRRAILAYLVLRLLYENFSTVGKKAKNLCILTSDICVFFRLVMSRDSEFVRPKQKLTASVFVTN